MGNPFSPLHPALQLIIREAKVLPATGQAIEDLMRPDHAEVVDGLRMGNEKHLDVIWEKPSQKPYVALSPLHRSERHVIRYFLDGSARTFFLGDILIGRQRSPVNVSQIGASAVFRNDNGHMHVAASRHQIVLMIEKRNVEALWEGLERIISPLHPRFVLRDMMADDGESEHTSPGKEPRSRAAHKAHHLMSEVEKEVGRTLPREAEQWLVLDGSLGKDLYDWKDVPNYFGVTKSFTRNPVFSMRGERGARKEVNIYELLAELPFSARTCVFSARAGKVAMWYVRIREQRHLEYPLMGVIKVEYPTVSGEPVESSLVDELSSALVAERQATPHGRDSRWHAHLYAVFLAEQSVKNGFISTEALKAGLKWPFDVLATTKESNLEQ